MKALDQVTMADLGAETAELLPTREALALVNVTNITAINVALAVNAGTVGSTAAAAALQYVAGYQN
jgi:hypothetical protein